MHLEHPVSSELMDHGKKVLVLPIRLYSSIEKEDVVSHKKHKKAQKKAGFCFVIRILKK